MKFRKIISLVLVVVCLVSVNGVPILSSVDTEGIDIQDNSVIAKKKKKKSKKSKKKTTAAEEETTESGSNEKKAENCTSILPSAWCENGENGDSLKSLLTVVLNVITAGVTVLGILGVVVAGLQYASARDNESQVVAAKKRILEVVIGLALWVLFGIVINYIVLGNW
jgi:hypothetical protein